MKIFDLLNEAEDNQERIQELLAQLKHLQDGHKYADHGAYSQDSRRMQDIHSELTKLGYYADLRNKNQSVEKPRSSDPKEMHISVEGRTGDHRELIVSFDHTENAGEHSANAANGIDYPVGVYRSYEYVRNPTTGEWVKHADHYGGVVAREGVISDGAKLKAVTRVWVRTPNQYSGKLDLLEPV
jgi:hypothetical protein